jgi:Na+/H+ antiporter NhaD/arsenite permease-like protein
VLGAPLVVHLIERHRLPRLPFLLALATAANTGSVATLVGNPQNMLCASLGGLVYREHLVLFLPVALTGLWLNHLLLRWMFRHELKGELQAGPKLSLLTKGSARTFVVIIAAGLLYTLGADLAWTATGGCAVLLVLHPNSSQEVWKRIDWSVLLFFAGLFVVVQALVKSGAPAWFFARFPLPTGGTFAAWSRLCAIFLFGSNVVSNVPFILVVREPMNQLENARLGWELLAMASTFAGNLTLLGSVANIIVAEKSRSIGGLGFWEHLRVGLPLSLLATLGGGLWLALVLR